MTLVGSAGCPGAARAARRPSGFPISIRYTDSELRP